MTVKQKTKTTDNKTEQNKAQCKLDRPTAKSFGLSSRNVGKYEFLTGKDVLPGKDLLKKAATIKKFEYLLLGSELKTQTDFAKKLYQKFENAYYFYKKGEDEVNNADQKEEEKK